jgi:hypothetical protein
VTPRFVPSEDLEYPEELKALFYKSQDVVMFMSAIGRLAIGVPDMPIAQAVTVAAQMVKEVMDFVDSSGNVSRPGTIGS